jgi:asparagine synthase (glutamine-hydrolysing)
MEKLIIQSLKIRLRSDVPLAFCLSGGIDSSLLAAITKKKLKQDINTFTLVDNDKRYSEKKNVNLICDYLNCQNIQVNLSNYKKNFFDTLKKLNFMNDAPVSVISYYIQSILTEQISKEGFKVSITGIGADEIFSGYYEHFLTFFYSIRKSKKKFTENLRYWKKFIKPILRNSHLKNEFFYLQNNNDRSLVFDHSEILKKFSSDNFSLLFSEEFFTKDLMRNRMLNELFYEIVPNILRHDDINHMMYGIENRSPFLDKSILNYSLKIKNTFLINNGFQKIILRDIAKKYLPNKIYSDRKKIGYNASIESLVDLSNKDTKEYIFDPKSDIYNYIHYKNFSNFFNNYKNKKLPNYLSKFLFSFLSTKVFLENSK